MTRIAYNNRSRGVYRRRWRTELQNRPKVYPAGEPRSLFPPAPVGFFKKLPLIMSDGVVEQLQPGNVLLNQQGTVVYAVAAFGVDSRLLRSKGAGFGSETSNLTVNDNQTGVVVSAAASFATDNAILRSDGTETGSQGSSLRVTDLNQITFPLNNVLLGDDDTGGLLGPSSLGNVFLGSAAGGSSITGISNFGLGRNSLVVATGNENVAIGSNAGNALTTGSSNVFLGEGAGGGMGQHATASNSIAIGRDVRTTASDQVNIGNASITETILHGEITLVAVEDGTVALLSPVISILDSAGTSSFEIRVDVVASKNTLLGQDAGASITSGSGDGTGNTLVGVDSGTTMTTGDSNVGLGEDTLKLATTGSQNMAIGSFALGKIVSGDFNTAVGYASLLNIVVAAADNTAIGHEAGRTLTTGIQNTFIGSGAGHTGQTVGVDNSIGIGFDVVTTASNQVIIGNTSTTETLLRGDVTINNGGLTLEDGEDIVLDTTNGTNLGTAVGQKLGFWGKAPITQPTDALQAALTNSTGGSQDGTLAAVGDTSAGDESIPINDNFTDIHTLLSEIRDALVDSGLMKGTS